MKTGFTAVAQKDGDWWVGWVEEVPGVNAQERTREELVQALSEALEDILELNGQQAREAIQGDYEEISIPA
jgi:predicted RNase H-like HicB family nuclease